MVIKIKYNTIIDNILNYKTRGYHLKNRSYIK